MMPSDQSQTFTASFSFTPTKEEQTKIRRLLNPRYPRKLKKAIKREILKCVYDKRAKLWAVTISIPEKKTRYGRKALKLCKIYPSGEIVVPNPRGGRSLVKILKR